MPVHRAVFGRCARIAAGADNTLRPAIVCQIGLAVVLIMKHFLKLADGHLVNVHRARFLKHGVSPLSAPIRVGNYNPVKYCIIAVELPPAVPGVKSFHLHAKVSS